jgi:hypothetical protein
MEQPNESQTSAERVQRHRDRLRAKGMRPIQLWVVDVRTPEFASAARVQAAAVATSEHAAADQAFIDAVSDNSL